MATRWGSLTLRCCFCENPLWQWSHTKGRSPVWILLCDCKFVVSANRAPHRSQTNGRSPVWVRSCLVFCPFSRNLNFPVENLNRGSRLDLPFRAESALIGHFSSVNSFMSFQTSRLWKWFITNVTCIRFLAGMSSIMEQQIGTTGKFTATDLAFQFIGRQIRIGTHLRFKSWRCCSFLGSYLYSRMYFQIVRIGFYKD